VSTSPVPDTSGTSIQRRSAGASPSQIKSAALTLSSPQVGLSWVDVGAGTGDLLRTIRDEWQPLSLTSVDVLPWLADDLKADVSEHVGDPLEILPALEPSDRVISVETLEHMEAPWTTLRLCARLVRPGGRLVVTTPNVATLRHRIELPLFGRLTSFRPHELQHLTPGLPHVIASILSQEGMTLLSRSYAGTDVIPLLRGRTWSPAAARRFPQLLNISLIIAATRPTHPEE
jgi:SAM-dependent methyltransferase